METVTVKQIHDSFFGAGESALLEAKRLLDNPLQRMDEEAQRFVKLGFTSAKQVKDYEAAKKAKEVAKETIAAIEYFAVHYPNYKFIKNEDVKKLCEKYGLMEGGCEQYLGDIPEKNLRDIESFKLRKEDYIEKQTFEGSLFRWFEPGRPTTSLPSDLRDGTIGFISSKSRQSGRSQSQNLFNQYLSGTDPYWDDRFFDRQMAAAMMAYLLTATGQPFARNENIELEQPKFRICAPKSDFNTSGYEVKDGYKLVYDPIVLQPVEYKGVRGNLIITAWGNEASDEIVVNQQMN